MMTLSKLAKLAHVSLSTASKAFSMSSEVNEETREMIFELARKHGCFKKFYNAKYPKLVIAVICPEFKSRYYSSIVSSIQENLSKMDSEICVASTDFSEDKRSELYDYYNNYSNVDGIIMIDSGKYEHTKSNVPVVTTGKSNGKTVSVYSNSSLGINMAVDYFLSKGIKDIGFISEKYTMSKLVNFRDYINKKLGNICEDYLSVSEHRMELGGYEAMEEFFKRKTIPRAIICAYDCMAIGAMKCVFDHGLNIPDDVAIIGMNNNRETEFLNPALSSIDLCSEEAGREMSLAVINKIMGIETNEEIILTPKLILRESSEIK
ncbi:MAG: LacI family DNA-binding transcriptional regulator [Clostridia bacterium]|nr:LacI family DNA-binding transcriptional regulator [Clostridia bacterium]MBO7289294.1 LacI family DNA-binding transcriptional regulator [Clostridia bacterium]